MENFNFKVFATKLWGILKSLTQKNKVGLAELKELNAAIPGGGQALVNAIINASDEALDYNTTTETYNAAYRAVTDFVKVLTPETLVAKQGSPEYQAYDNAWKKIMDTLRGISAISPLWLQIALTFTDAAEQIEKDMRAQMKSVA